MVVSILSLTISIVAIIAAVIAIWNLDEAQRCCLECRQRIDTSTEKIGRVFSWGADLEKIKIQERTLLNDRISEVQEHFLKALASSDRSVAALRSQFIELKRAVPCKDCGKERP